MQAAIPFTKSLFDLPKVEEFNETVQEYISVPEFKMEFQFQTRGKKYQISSSHDAAKLCKQIIGGEMEWRENFIMLALNRQNSVISFSKISVGSVSGTIADPRIILQHALACNATGIILCHNHPSGSLKPSEQDKKLTATIKSAAELFLIKVVDHIIVSAEEGHYSFADDGLL